MADGARAISSAQLLFGFVAGFLATVIFHQLALALLWIIGVAPSNVSKNPDTKNGQNARRSHTNFSLQIGVT